MIDCYSRRLAGWAVADHMRTTLVEDALKSAAATRGSLTRGLAGAVFHSDHGSVYTSKDYANLCAELEVTQSMGAVGSSADNALAESFNATLKREVLQDAACWADETTCRRQVFRWIVRYNTRQDTPTRLLEGLVPVRSPGSHMVDDEQAVRPGTAMSGRGPCGR